MLRFLTAGESHGPGLTTVVEGLPKGLPLQMSDFEDELARRRHGYGRGLRMTIETDSIEILGGVRHGKTLGSPIAVVVRNSEWDKWARVMSIGEGEAGNEVTRPRPGHADLAGMIKYGTDDARDILERASARETAARTIAGVIAKRLLSAGGIAIVSHVVAIGGIAAKSRVPGAEDAKKIDSNPVRCLDSKAAEEMIAAIDKALEDKDTLGGVFEVVAHGVPIGIGSHVHHDRRLDSILAGGVMSIPAIKGVEIGDGFTVASLPGSQAHDEIVRRDGVVDRESNHAGGVEGGISNGQPIRVRAAMKPISTLMQPLKTIDMATGEPAQAVRERSDVCAVPAAAVVAEQMVSISLAQEMQRKFGGDTLDEFTSRVNDYRDEAGERL